ncbi:hypothetical protein PhCBS80983_g03167 [Powellomyces hirtus]|uniref:Pre-mRNA-processing factor 40 n=1 Tax=Powellomyces hirtus TaxID=109895 RepID=A0A507E3G1_9FUNG|nr:hypothetical protein PhCBS80983_g03167 [Powellomyces hirtus]
MSWAPHPHPNMHWPPRPSPGGPPGGPPGGDMGGPPTPPQWTTHTTSEGKTYYFNTVTKQSIWEKPDALKTPMEKALANTPWKEYTTDQGKKYFYNTTTKVTTWEIPAELKAVLDGAPKPAMSHPIPDVPPSTANALTVHGQRDEEPAKSLPLTPTTPATPVVDPYKNVRTDFATREEAEAAFMGLLKEAGVTHTWTWEETMRAIISHPLYRALKTLSERRSAYERYVDQKKREEADARKAKYDQDRVTLRTLFAEAQHNITSRTRYRKAAAILEDNEVFQAVNERDREAIFAEYVDDLKMKEKEHIRETRKDNVGKYERILQRLTAEGHITVETTWGQVQELYKAQPEYRADRKLQAMEPIDFLLTFEHHINDLVAKFRQKREAEQRSKRRQERIKRDAFRALLAELKADDRLHARTRWQQLLTMIKDDERYLQLFGQPGSTPLELFGDVMVEVIDEFRPARRQVEDLLKAANIEVLPGTPYEEFLQRVQAGRAPESENMKPTTLRLVFEECLEKAVEKAMTADREEKRKAERRLRKKMDAFKSYLKKLSPSITVASEWETVQSQVAGHHDYEGLEEAQRVEVFNKVILRLKEKADKRSSRNGVHPPPAPKSDYEDDDEEGSLRDVESGEQRGKRKRSTRHGGGGGERERERDHRDRGASGSSRRHRRHRSRSASVEERGDRDRDRDHDYASRDRKRSKPDMMRGEDELPLTSDQGEQQDVHESGLSRHDRKSHEGSSRRRSSNPGAVPGSDVAALAPSARRPPPPNAMTDESEEEGELR